MSAIKQDSFVAAESGSMWAQLLEHVGLHPLQMPMGIPKRLTLPKSIAMDIQMPMPMGIPKRLTLPKPIAMDIQMPMASPARKRRRFAALATPRGQEAEVPVPQELVLFGAGGMQGEECQERAALKACLELAASGAPTCPPGGPWDKWGWHKLLPKTSEIMRVPGMTLSVCLRTFATALDLRPCLSEVDDDDPFLVPLLLYMGCELDGTEDLAKKMKAQMGLGDKPRWKVLRAALLNSLGKGSMSLRGC